jgi:hypothetical protein
MRQHWLIYFAAFLCLFCASSAYAGDWSRVIRRLIGDFAAGVAKGVGEEVGRKALQEEGPKVIQRRFAVYEMSAEWNDVTNAKTCIVRTQNKCEPCDLDTGSAICYLRSGEASIDFKCDQQSCYAIAPMRVIRADPSRNKTPLALLKMVSAGRWAVGGSANCGVRSKTYALEIAGNLAKWRNGSNKMFIERIETNSETEARTVTDEGPQMGTVWTYSKIGVDKVHVQPSGKTPFILGRCVS